MEKEKIILGIDPGTNVLGFGIIEVKNNKIKLLEVGILKLNSKEELGIRLKKIFFKIIELIDAFHPDELAIEAQFFGENVQSMLKLGKAQGICIAAALSRDIPYCEYAPRKIKQSITGRGTASKEQVAAMLDNILNIKINSETLDATDGLATAVCHFYQSNTLGGKSKYTSWDAFIKNNPGKIK